jgi:starch-binding outer membrane protein, SusD/RagB family
MRTLTLHQNRTRLTIARGVHSAVGRAMRALSLLPALVLSGACGELTSLEQEAPARVIADNLIAPENAQLLVTGAISDLECALAQYIVATALVGDEFIDAQLSQVGWDYDRRSLIPALTAYASNTCTATQVPGIYTPVQVARYQSDVILTALEGWTDQQVTNRTDLIAQAAAHAGYAITYLAESMCSAAIDGGPEMSRAELFAAAEDRFTRAIAAATTPPINASIRDMALVGRARVRLNVGRGADARADAALVPPTFVRNATYSAPPAPARRQNLVHTQQFVGFFSSVDPSFRNLTVEGVPDTRVTVVDAGRNGHDAATRVWRTTKYAAPSTPIPIASYDEAQLIIAEVDAANAGTAGNAVAIINALRTRAGLPTHTGGTTPAEVQALVREERRRELFLEGQRFGDIVRLDIPLTPAAGTAYPVKGGTYGPDRGSQVCIPVPDLERNNNPNF